MFCRLLIAQLLTQIVLTLPLDGETDFDENLLDSHLDIEVIPIFKDDDDTAVAPQEITDKELASSLKGVIEQLKEYRFLTNLPYTAKASNLPKEVIVTSGAIGGSQEDKAEDSSPRQSKKLKLDFDGVPIIEGLYVPDDQSDQKTYRNARVINNQLVENSSINWGEVFERQGRLIVPELEDSSNAVNETEEYPEFYYRSYRKQDEVPLAEEVATSSGIEDQFGYNLRFSYPLEQAQPSLMNNNKEQSVMELSSGAQANVKMGSRKDDAEYNSQRQSKKIRFDYDGLPIIEGLYVPDDQSDQKIYRNARVINNQLVENASINWDEVFERQGRLIVPELGDPLNAVNETDEDPEFYYRSYWNEDEPLEEAKASSEIKDPFGYSLRSSYSPEKSYQPLRSNDGEDYVKEFSSRIQTNVETGRKIVKAPDDQQYTIQQHLYKNDDGSVFSVPIPFPALSSTYDPRVQYFPINNIRERSKAAIMKDKVVGMVARMQEMARPVVDPLKEAKEKISYNLGIPERISSFQSRISKASSDPKTAALAGGAAAFLGTVGAGLLISGSAAGRASRKLKEKSKNVARNLTKRAIDEDQELLSQLTVFDEYLAKLDVSEQEFIKAVHRDNFVKAVEGPCGKTVMCQRLAEDPSRKRFQAFRSRAALVSVFLEENEAEALQETVESVIYSAEKNNCSVFHCDDYESQTNQQVISPR
ncbi:uncharacterized protein LOC136029114 isoform X2 [Artemia franciscana]|uniref:Uncharacterized protein n=2 Tax=Artemia franciscana TaxID=6661 RepID=A0AA88KWQ6_ARTSF|nr:hypothetical protein QYM36_014756 [Artemia franciscana]